MNEYQKQYYQKNRERIIARQKEYNARHKEEKAEYDKKRKQKIWKPDEMVMGVKRENKSIYVAKVPGRKKLCLVCGEKNTGTIVATFSSVEEVKLFEEYINFICFGLSKKKENK